MSNSPGHIPITIHPAIRNLNVRQISKIIATKIIKTTGLQLQFNPIFCSQLDVAQHLNTYEAVAYFTDNQYFEAYGFRPSKLSNFQKVYEEIIFQFNAKVKLSIMSFID
ncbi:hypothetical protein [Acinetobacter sp. TR11]|uniref:hypothetical protein n=1 Tax=Acinetobacter sp. TR11 TaxID=3003393 RepID=UPI0022ABDDD8|nr:hypothetical protein [Acinetobacter sp. TR11]WAU74717.1 hypothetical protein O1450_06400 [Acinetobacter sp. TR11]